MPLKKFDPTLSDICMEILLLYIPSLQGIEKKIILNFKLHQLLDMYNILRERGMGGNFYWAQNLKEARNRELFRYLGT
jgi:hypothetical protein